MVVGYFMHASGCGGAKEGKGGVSSVIPRLKKERV